MVMRLARYIRFTCFVPNLAESRREDALRWIIHAATEEGVIADEKLVLEKLMEREEHPEYGDRKRRCHPSLLRRRDVPASSSWRTPAEA